MIGTEIFFFDFRGFVRARIPLRRSLDPARCHESKIFLMFAIATLAVGGATPQTRTFKFPGAMRAANAKAVHDRLHRLAGFILISDNVRLIVLVAGVVETRHRSEQKQFPAIHHANPAYEAFDDIGALVSPRSASSASVKCLMRLINSMPPVFAVSDASQATYC